MTFLTPTIQAVLPNSNTSYAETSKVAPSANLTELNLISSNIQITKSKSLYIFSSGHTIHIWQKQNVLADRTASVRLNLIAGAVAGLTTS